jgi:PleD family two-component response regulator
VVGTVTAFKKIPKVRTLCGCSHTADSTPHLDLASGVRPSVLVVDDCPEDRERIRRLLSAKGTCEFKLLDAETSQEAIDLFRSYNVECIVLDCRLPGVDGIGLTSYVRSSYYERDVAIILISGVADERIVADAFKAGANYYLSKSWLNEAFVLVVDRAIRKVRQRQTITPAYH